MTQAATLELCGGVTKPLSPQPLRRCTNCDAYRWGAAELKPQMRQQADGTWHCQNERPVWVVQR